MAWILIVILMTYAANTPESGDKRFDRLGRNITQINFCNLVERLEYNW